MTTHGWETSSQKDNIHTTVPLRSDVLNQLAKEAPGPKEGTKEHRELQEKRGFSYRTLLGEMMFAYVSCRLDIGYAITLMSKYSSHPSEFHYNSLKSIAKYLRTTKEWGIIFHRKGTQRDFPTTNIPEIPTGKQKLPTYPTDTTKAKLVCFVDAAYGNNPTKRRSTTGYALTHCGGAILYQSKAQSITALSSTEAELIAAVTAAKNIKYT